jgi:hypothetical protein
MPILSMPLSRGTLLGRSGNSGFPLPGAIIDEWFTQSKYFPGPIASDLVDTRSTTKLITDTAGLLSSVAINTLPISNAGMLVEPAATNLALWSQDFTNAAWNPFTGGTGTISTTAASGIAPDGTNTATLITINRSSATFSDARVGSLFTGTAAAYTGSVYLKANGAGDVGKIIDVCFYNGTSVLSVSHMTLTSAWQRVSVTGTLAASASCEFIFGYLSSNSGGSNQLGSTSVLVWQADVVLGAMSSPIKTTNASLTRSADSIVVQHTGIGSVVFTFDDNSQQTISGINTATQYTIPTNLSRALIKRMTGYAVAAWILSSGLWSDLSPWVDTATWNG